MQQYKAVIDDEINKQVEIQEVVKHLADNTGPEYKEALQYVCDRLENLDTTPCKKLCIFAIETLKPRIGIFMKEDARFKREYALLLNALGDN